MIKFLYKINKKYDQIKEPKRFGIFMLMLVPVVVMQGVAEHMERLNLYVGSWAILLTMLTVRVLYMHKAFHPKVKADGE